MPKRVVLKSLALTEEEYHMYEDESLGYCTVCGATRDCTEPDARMYLCDECGSYAVYGIAELLLDGLLSIK